MRHAHLSSKTKPLKLYERYHKDFLSTCSSCYKIYIRKCIKQYEMGSIGGIFITLLPLTIIVRNTVCQISKLFFFKM